MLFKVFQWAHHNQWIPKNHILPWFDCKDYTSILFRFAVHTQEPQHFLKPGSQPIEKKSHNLARPSFPTSCIIVLVYVVYFVDRIVISKKHMW